MSAYVSQYPNVSSRSSYSLSNGNKHTDWLDERDRSSSRQTYMKQSSNSKSFENRDRYEDNRNVRYMDAGMVSDATKRRSAMMSNDDLKYTSQYDLNTRDRLGGRYSKSNENLASQYGLADSSYKGSSLNNGRTTSPDRGRVNSEFDRYQSSLELIRNRRSGSDLDRNLVKSSERDLLQSYKDPYSIQDAAKKSDFSNSYKENIGPTTNRFSLLQPKPSSYNSELYTKKNDEIGSSKSKYSYLHNHAKYSEFEENANGNKDQAKYRADILNGGEDQYNGYRHSHSAKNQHDDLLYDDDKKIKYLQSDYKRTSSTNGYYRDEKAMENKISNNHRSSSSRSQYLDNIDDDRERSLKERLKRLEAKHAELENNERSSTVRRSASVSDDLDRISSPRHLNRSGDHLYKDLYDREVSTRRSYDSNRFARDPYHTGHNEGNSLDSPRFRKSESVLRENQKNALERQPSDREHSSALGIRRDARSIEDSLEKKSVTWGENSFHELLGDYMSDDGVKQSSARRDLRRMEAIDGGRKILDIGELKEERRKRLETLKGRNAESSKYIKADLTGTDCDTVYDTVQLLGMVLSKPKDTNCSLIWNDSFVSLERISLLEPHQRINHFAGMDEIGKVENLVKNINKMAALHPNEYNFLPKSWVLPDDLEKFQAGLNQAKTKTKKQYFIVKPASGSTNGRIALCSSTDDISKFTQDGQRVVIQKYIENPLLVNNCKSHIRLYAVITSCCPLRIFLYSDGLVHLATEKYEELCDQNMKDLDVHLTNEVDGSKLTLKKLLQFLEDREAGSRHGRGNIDKLWSKLNDLVVQTLLAAQPSVYKSYNICRIVDSETAHNTESVCFEILAFDVLLDTELKPWLLQVNRSPDFNINDRADGEIKPGVIEDALLLLNLKSSVKRSTEESTEATLKALNKLEDKCEKPTTVEDIKLAVKKIVVACSADFNCRKFSEGCGRYRLVFPPRDRASLELYCELMESAHIHLLQDSEHTNDQSLDIQRYIMQKNREHVNNLIKNRSSTKRSDVKSFEKIDINEELTLKTLKALKEAHITLPGRSEKSTENLLEKTKENWSENKRKVAEYWFINLGTKKQGKVIDIVREKVRDIALRTWGIVDVERVKLYRIFLRVFTRLLVNHGQALWDCFDRNRKSSSWEMIFSKSTEVISETELDCCRRVVQLCCDCLLVLYHCAVDVRASHNNLSIAS